MITMKTCECTTWARDSNGCVLFLKHHPNCERYRPELEIRELLQRLIDGIESWASDEDGVHEGCWDAYVKACNACGQYSRPAIQPTSGQLAPPEPIPFNPPYVPVEPSGFQIPTGTYRGRRLSELDNDTLRNLYNGFNGCRRNDIAETILAEIHSRQGNL